MNIDNIPLLSIGEAEIPKVPENLIWAIRL